MYDIGELQLSCRAPFIQSWLRGMPSNVSTGHVTHGTSPRFRFATGCISE